MILGAAAGAPVCRESFSLRYGPAIRDYLAARWRLDPGHDAVEDATQDVMVECFKRSFEIFFRICIYAA